MGLEPLLLGLLGFSVMPGFREEELQTPLSPEFKLEYSKGFGGQ
jgi:hypothetical protein